MPLFSIPLSGLNASSTAMSTIANNLANLNTVGYKASSTQFQDLFYQTMGTNGAGDPIQVGAGTSVSATAMNLTAGSPESTGVATDVAIMGNGYFVVQDNGVNAYTRAGNFAEKDGYLETQNGEQVMGYSAVNGVIPSGAPLSPLQISQGQINPPNPTSTLQMETNLDASSDTGTTPLSSPMTVYDSLGTSHVVNFTYTKTAANTWSCNITIPNSDVNPPSGWTASQAYTAGQMVAPVPANGHIYQCTTAGTSGTTAPSAWPTDGSSISDGGVTWQDMGTQTTIDTQTLTFDSSGKLTSPTGNVAGIKIPGLSDGAATMDMQWTLYDSSGAPLVSQVAAPSTTTDPVQNGYGSGSLSGYNIATDGTIMGSFSNGRTAALGQIALATFSNPQGLERQGDNEFSATLASGAPTTGAPGTGGRGSVSGETLELSNVDIATEFSALIVAQRGYEANARTITTFDQIMQDTINLKPA